MQRRRACHRASNIPRRRNHEPWSGCGACPSRGLSHKRRTMRRNPRNTCAPCRTSGIPIPLSALLWPRDPRDWMRKGFSVRLDESKRRLSCPCLWKRAGCHPILDPTDRFGRRDCRPSAPIDKSTACRQPKSILRRFAFPRRLVYGLEKANEPRFFWSLPSQVLFRPQRALSKCWELS